MITKNSGIYKLTNLINGKIYIGKANNLKERIRRHEISVRKILEKYPISSAIKKYGWENFKVDILEEFSELDIDHLLNREAYWIEYYNSTNNEIGYNILKFGSDWTGYKHSEETKKVMKEKAKLRNLNGKNNPMYGKPRTQEVKDAISLKRTGVRNTKNFKPIAQLNPKTGQIIKIWPSVTDAAKGLNLSITHIAAAARQRVRIMSNGKTRIEDKAGGFKWSYLPN